MVGLPVTRWTTGYWPVNMIVDFVPNPISVSHMDFWSVFYKDACCESVFTITSTAADQSLPSVTVSEIPVGATVSLVKAMLKYRVAKDTSATKNSLVINGTEHIQVDKTGCTYIDAIELVKGMIEVEASSESGGDLWVGSINISSEVTGDDTYEFQWEGSDAIGNNLLIRDLQTGLRVYFN